MRGVPIQKRQAVYGTCGTVSSYAMGAASCLQKPWRFCAWRGTTIKMRKNNYANAECLAPDVKRNRFVCGPRFPFGSFAPHPILLAWPVLVPHVPVQDYWWNPCGFRIPSKPHCIRRRLGPEFEYPGHQYRGNHQIPKIGGNKRQDFDQGFGIPPSLCAHVNDVKIAPATKGETADFSFCFAVPTCVHPSTCKWEMNSAKMLGHIH